MLTKDKEELITLIAAEVAQRAFSLLAKHTAVEIVRENLIKDIEKLSRLTSSAFQVFYYVFSNGPSNALEIHEGTQMPARTIYFALKQLKDANLISEDREHRWFITAKGFAPFCR